MIKFPTNFQNIDFTSKFQNKKLKLCTVLKYFCRKFEELVFTRNKYFGTNSRND